ncbi:MAG: nucleoside hydrolase, partial [Cyanobacteria bacterium]|nr:nucleoside hydrolase [Cyanobacteriota bacterium]
MKISASSFPPISAQDFQLTSPLRNKVENNNTPPLQFQGNASFKKAIPRWVAMGSLFTSILFLSGLGSKQVKSTREASSEALVSNSLSSTKNQPPLTLEEAQSLDQIQALALKNPIPTPLIIIADTGAYHDDEGAFVVAGQLQKMGLVDIKAVVANLYPSTQRARLTQGTLQQLGLGNIPVGVGSTCGQTTLPKPPEFDVPYMTSEKQPLPTGAMLLKKTLQEAPDKSLTLLLLSGMTDANDLLAAEPALFKQKIKQMVIMGGVTQNPETFKVLLNEKGLMTPNTAFNNNVD